MVDSSFDTINLNQLMELMFKPHPWHGIAAYQKSPHLLNVYIEIVPTDTVKYEIDKYSGYLKLDRIQKYSSLCPTLYGFIPQTYCDEQVANYCMQQTGRSGIVGDGDPLDICVLTERPISHGDILVRAIPIGGLRMIDKGQADDKIIAVLQDDALYGKWQDISDCPSPVIDRIRHYFLTYKEPPDSTQSVVEITHIYTKAEAIAVVEASIRDYQQKFGDAQTRFTLLQQLLREK